MRTTIIAALVLVCSVSIALGKKPGKNSGHSFNQLDDNHDKKISLREFIHGKANAGAAEKEFAVKDKNNDAFLSEAEFHGSKKKKKK